MMSIEDHAEEAGRHLSDLNILYAVIAILEGGTIRHRNNEADRIIKICKDGAGKSLRAYDRRLASLSPDGKLKEALREAADKFDDLAASMREEDAALLAQEIAVAELGRDECRAALGQEVRGD